MLLVNEWVSATLQLMLFVLIPWVVYWVRHRSVRGFLDSVGIIKPTVKSVRLSLLFSLAIFLLTFGVLYMLKLTPHLSDPATTAGQIKSKDATGFILFVIILIRSYIQTALAEEILFRGFIGKQLIHRLGFGVGNFLQSLLFGVIHAAMYTSIDGITFAHILLLSSVITFTGYMLGYIKETLAGGSIIPGWISHGTSNVLSFSIVVFLL